MRKPRTAVFVLGHPASVVAIVGISGLMTYQWWVGELQSVWIPILAFFACGAVMNASQKRTAFREWKQSWDIMGGAPPPRPGRMGMVVYLAIWAVIAIVLVNQLDYHRPLHLVGLISFAAATLLMLRQVFPRRARAARQQRSGKPAIVTAVPAVPRHSPSVAQAAQALPAYCAGLLAS